MNTATRSARAPFEMVQRITPIRSAEILSRIEVVPRTVSRHDDLRRLALRLNELSAARASAAQASAFPRLATVSRDAASSEREELQRHHAAEYHSA